MVVQDVIGSGDVRSSILREATRLFAAHGFDGTTIQAIADAVGVTKPAVIHHFASKEALRLAVLEQVLQHWQRVLPELLLKATASEDRFDAVVGELHRFFASAPELARLILREALDRPKDVAGLLKGALRPWLNTIAAYIRTGQQTGRHYADVDPDAYVALILQFIVTSSASAALFVSALDGDRGESHERLSRETERIAKASVFQTLERKRPAKARDSKAPAKAKAAVRPKTRR